MCQLLRTVGVGLYIVVPLIEISSSYGIVVVPGGGGSVRQVCLLA